MTRRTFVPPSGNPNAKLAGVGEQPGQYEIRARPPRPFVGPAGQGLDKCLAMAKIQRSSLYLTNVIKDLDHPLKYYINIDSRGKSTISPEGYQYIQELGDELRTLNPNCVVAFGNVPLLALTNRIGITKWRGSVLESTLVPGLKVIPTFHPATFIRPKFKFLNKPLICSDLERAKYEVQFRELERKERKVYIKRGFDETMSILNHCYEVGLRGQTIAIDIEVLNGEVDCISLGWSPEESISIPFKDRDGDYFVIEQEHQIMLLIGKILQEERIAKVGANFIFDTQFLLHKYGILPRGILHCTQIAQKISFPDYSAGLDFVTTMHTDIPYYKQDGKQWIRMGTGTWEEWWNYNGLDSIVPVEAIPKQLAILRGQENMEVYDRHTRLIKPLIYMSEHGIRVDVDGMRIYKEQQQEELDNLVEQLHEEVGYTINPNSPQQLMQYFYNECGIKPYKTKGADGKYRITTDVDALKRISRLGVDGSNVAKLMLDIRSLNKRLSTYLNIGKVDKDARYRSSYKPVGAETGRLSSGETIFGTGGNQQNWPHDLLRFFLFDEGYIGYSIDLSQIENRLVAYVGGVTSQIEAFESGVDLHKLTASIILGKPYDEISNVDGSSPIGDGRQSERYWGKKGNHATNYDVGYKTFALKNELTESSAKQILESIHLGYPQIRGGYHVVIQNMLKKNRIVTNLYGRNRLFLGPIIPAYPDVPQSACLKTYRDAYAHLPQSTTADKINKEGILHIWDNQQLYKPIELLTQIHDSIVFQIPLSIPFTEHARMILSIKNSLEKPLEWHGRAIPTPADLAIGLNMCKEEMIELKSMEIPNNIELLAKKIEDAYVRLQRTP